MLRRAGRISEVIENQRRTLLLWAPVAFGGGIALYFSQASEPVPARIWLLLAAMALTATAALYLPRLRAPMVLMTLAICGFVTAFVHTQRMAAPVLTESYFGPVIGRVVGLDRSEQNRLRLMLDRVHLPGMAPATVPRRVRIVLARPPPEGVVFAGARVMLRARLGPPPPPVEPDGFDFRRHAWFLRLGAIGYAAEPVVLARPRTPPDRDLWLFDLRMALADAIRARMPQRSGGFAAAILTGDRSGVDPADLIDLRASNLAHLLAISGLHMGLLSGAIFFVVRLALVLLPGQAARGSPKKVAAVAAVLAGAGYLALSGASVATQRAFVMAAVMFGAVLIDRPALTLRAVAVAALIVLAWRPVSLMGPGFQMSFAATIALIAGYGWLKDRAVWRGLNGRAGGSVRFVIGLGFTSLVAGLATAPFSAFHFNQISQFGLLANILAVPAMGFVVMPAGVLALVLWPVGGEGIGLDLMQLGIDHILRVAHWVAGLDGAVRFVPTGPAWVPGAVAVGGIALAALRGRIRLLGAGAILGGLLVWGGSERPAVLIDSEGGLVGVLTAEGRALNRARGMGFAARVWLENDGDAADQKLAAGRAAPEKTRFSIGLPDGRQLLWLKSDLAQAADCKAHVLIVAPKQTRRPGGVCDFVGSVDLARNGAHAFYSGNAQAPRTVRAVSGDRPWTQPGQSRPPDQ